MKPLRKIQSVSLAAALADMVLSRFTVGHVQHHLDMIHSMVENGNLQEGMEELMCYLWEAKSHMLKDQWTQFCEQIVLRHPLTKIIHEDPFSRHAYEQPRGYPGDPALLDYIYDGNSARLPHGTSAIGKALFKSNIQAPSCQAVRARMRLIRRKIDTLAKNMTPRILSVACGHLRELDDSNALKSGRIKEFLALDQDPQAVQRCQREFGQYGVRVLCKAICWLLLNKKQFGEFDLIYAAGLYDYLSDRLAIKLTRHLFNMLSPGGFLLIPNFRPHILGWGYMEAFMRWYLIYRDYNDMQRLWEGIDSNHVSDMQIWEEPNGNIIFLEIQRKD